MTNTSSVLTARDNRWLCACSSQSLAVCLLVKSVAMCLLVTIAGYVLARYSRWLCWLVTIAGYVLARHGRSVTEIWGRDEMKNVDLWGGGRNKEFGPFGGRNFKIWSMYTQKPRKSSYNGKTLKIERFFARLLHYKRSSLQLRRRRNKFSVIFLSKRNKRALKKTILRDLVPNCGPLSGVGGGRIPLISPQPTPMLVTVAGYVLARDNHWLCACSSQSVAMCLLVTIAGCVLTGDQEVWRARLKGGHGPVRFLRWTDTLATGGADRLRAAGPHRHLRC